MSTIFLLFTPNQPVAASIIGKLLDASAYWRPDHLESSVVADSRVALAKAHLYTSKRSVADGIHECKKSGNWAVANARLDNRDQLTDALSRVDGKKSELQTLSDGELILHAYGLWGEDCTAHLLGDFAFVIWDQAMQKVFAARDHFGIKLLSYAITPDGILVTNEPAAFITSGWLAPVLDERWVVRQIWGQGFKAEFAFKGIKPIPPAHGCVYADGEVAITRYWQLHARDPLPVSADDAIEQLRQLFRAAVLQRTETDFPLSCQLSEGLDSNGIAGMAAKLLSDNTIYTLSYDCEKLTEQNQAVWGETYKDIEAMLAMHENLQPLWTNDIKDNNADHQALIAATQGAVLVPAGWFSHFRLANNIGSRVMLSGWGGDHCVSGYGDYYESELILKGQLCKVNQLFKQRYARGRGAPPPRAWLALLLKHLYPGLHQLLLRRRHGLIGALWRRRLRTLLRSEYVQKYGLVDELSSFLSGYERYSVQGQHDRELFEIGVDGRLMYSELTARKWRLEYRYPMLSVPLVEFAYQLPSELKCWQGIERYPFRKVLEGLTTERIQWRIKADVAHPQKEHFSAVTSAELQNLRTTLSGTEFERFLQLPPIADIQSPDTLFHFRRYSGQLAPVFDYHIKRGHKVAAEG